MAPFTRGELMEMKELFQKFENHFKKIDERENKQSKVQELSEVEKMRFAVQENNKQLRDIFLAAKITLGHDTVIEEDK